VLRDDPSLLTPANLYRLAGDPRAHDLLVRLRDELVADDPTSRALLVDACFLLGDDDGAMAAAAALERPGVAQPGARSRDVGLLAAGRARGDVALLDAAVAALDRTARRHPGELAGTGGTTWHDWLELALVTRVQVSGEPSDRLREL
jgi:hypothetical protein